MATRIIQLTPVAKPRMTRRDRWAERPCVVRYRRFRNELRKHVTRLPDRYHVFFHIPMPKSWSRTKRNTMSGQPHQQTPDADNLIKAIQDAVHGDDSFIWDVRATKLWSEEGRIVIVPIKPYTSSLKGVGCVEAT